LKIDFDFELFWDRFWLHFGSQNASLWAPFWRSKSIKKTIRNRTASKVAPRSPQERPRPSQDAPRSPPECPRTPQEASRIPPGPPPDAPRSSPDPPGRPKTFSEASGPITFFGKIEKFEIVENMSKKKSTSVFHGGHSHRSLKSRKHFHNGRTQRVAAVVARSALQSAAPSAARRVESPL
jgi:hypothetical protein